jgi:hypothetical protein
VYDLATERNSEQYVKTTKQIINWVGREYTKHTRTLVEAVEVLQLDAPIAPVVPDDGNPVEFELWKMEVRKHQEKEEAFDNFKARLFAVVKGQCSEALEDRLKSHSGWSAAQQDGIELLRLIKTITYTYEERCYPSEALLDVKEEFYSLRQGKFEPLQRYYERFMNQVSVMDEIGVTYVDEAQVKVVAAANNRAGNPDDDDRLEGMNRTLAARFIRGANKKADAYRGELRNSYLNGNDDYPTSLTQAYNIMQRHSEMNAPVIEPDGSGSGIAFVTAGRNGRTYNHITCHNCNRTGH